MYVLVYIAVLVLVLFLTKAKYGTIRKSNVLFSSMWCVFASISSLGLYGIYRPSELIHLYSLTAILAFNGVFLLSNSLVKNQAVNATDIQGSVRLKSIVFVNLLAWMYSIPFMDKSLKIISSIGFRGLRAYAFNVSMGLGSSHQLLILQWGVHSVFIATVLLAMVHWAIGRKSKTLLVLAIIDTTVYTLLFAGRYMIFRMIFYYIFTYVIVNPPRLDKLKGNKLKNLLFVVLVVMILIFLTSQRNWGNSSFIKSFVEYFSGSFSFLNALVHNSTSDKSLFYGRGMFGFIINPIIAVFSLLTGSHYRTGSDYLITEITAVPIPISFTFSYNAMPTMLYTFLRDFGYLGIIFGSGFLAWLVSFAEKMFNRDNRLLSLSLYVFLGFVVFDSVLTYDLLYAYTGVTLVLVFLFIKMGETNKPSSRDRKE